MTTPSPSTRLSGVEVGDAWTTLFDTATDVVAWVDRDLRYRYVNRAIETATGRPAVDFIGRTNEEIGAPAGEAALWRARLTEVLASSQPALFEFEFDTQKAGVAFNRRPHRSRTPTAASSR